VGKRATSRKKKGKPASPGPGRRPAAAAGSGAQSPWPGRLGEALLIALVVLVPIVINPRSKNLTDVKDVALGLGVAAGIGLWLVAGLAQGRLSWARSRLNLLVLAFLGWTAISISYAQFRYVAVAEFGRLAANVGIYLLAVVFLRTSRQVIRVAIAAVLGSVPVSIYAFAQAAGKDFIPYTIGQIVRVFSFLGNPTFLGGYLILLIPVAIAIAWPRRSEDAESGKVAVAARTVGIGLTALMMLISLYFSFTIGGVIGLGLGTAAAVLLAIVRGGRKMLRVGVPAIAAGVLLLALLGLGIYRVMPAKQQARVQTVLHFEDPYARERQLHWRTAFGIFREAPVLGRGYGNFRAVALERMATEWYLQQPEHRQGMLATGYAHNEYLQVLADIGLVGGVLFLVMLLAALALAVRVYWRTEDAGWRRFGLAVLVALIAFLFQNFFGVTFRQTGSVTFFWLWLGALALAGASLQREGTGAGGPALREFRFRRLSMSGVAASAVAAAALFVILAWTIITPVRASVLVRFSQFAAAQAQKAVTEAQAGAAQGEDKETQDRRQRTILSWYKVSEAKAQEAVRLCPYSALGYYHLAYAEGQLGELADSPEVRRAQFEKAATASRRALDLMPGSGPMYYNLAVTYKRLGRLADAEAAFREAVRLTPTILQHYAALAETLLEEKKYSEAEAYALKAAKMDSKNSGVREMLAALYQKQGHRKKAIGSLAAAIRLDPTKASYRQEMAELLLHYRQFRKGLPACEEWLALAPRSAAAHYALGFAHYNLQHYAEARAAFERALALDPDLRQARLYLAFSLIRLGETKRGTEELRYLATTASKSREGRQARKLLRDAERRATGSPRAGRPATREARPAGR